MSCWSFSNPKYNIFCLLFHATCIYFLWIFPPSASILFTLPEQKPLKQLSWVSTVLQVFVLLFIFVKRQIVRFAMKSRRGPHVPLGHNAPKVCLFYTRAHTVKTLAHLLDNAPEASCQTILLIHYSRVVSVLCAAGAQTRNWSQTEPCPENPLWASSAVRRRWPTEAQRAFWLERWRRTHTCWTMLF